MPDSPTCRICCKFANDCPKIQPKSVTILKEPEVWLTGKSLKQAKKKKSRGRQPAAASSVGPRGETPV